MKKVTAALICLLATPALANEHDPCRLIPNTNAYQGDCSNGFSDANQDGSKASGTSDGGHSEPSGEGHGHEGHGE